MSRAAAPGSGSVGTDPLDIADVLPLPRAPGGMHFGGAVSPLRLLDLIMALLGALLAPASRSSPAAGDKHDGVRTRAPAEASPPAPAAPPGGALPPSDGKRITFINDGNKPMHLKFTANAGMQPMPDLRLAAGERRTVPFPEKWSGNWRSTAGKGDAFTLGEVTLQGQGRMSFYDDSRIEGSNMGQTIEPAGGGRKTGTLDNLLAGAPRNLLALDRSGQPYGIRKSTVAEMRDPAVIGYLQSRIPRGAGYTHPYDDASTAGTIDDHLVVHLKDFT